MIHSLILLLLFKHQLLHLRSICPEIVLLLVKLPLYGLHSLLLLSHLLQAVLVVSLRLFPLLPFVLVVSFNGLQAARILVNQA